MKRADVPGKAPGFWYYPTDFEKDAQILSLSAQGLWIRILGWMHENESHRGFLELPSGNPMTPADVSAKVGKPMREVEKAIAEMERIPIFSRDERGCIYCRRMARETYISSVRREAASKRLQAAQRAENGTFAGVVAGTNSQQTVSKTPSVSDSVSDSVSSSRPAADEQPAKRTFPLDVWADRLYSKHVKRRDRPLVNAELFRLHQRCLQRGVDPEQKFTEIEACLIAWNETSEWRENNGRYAPKLADWLRDEGFDQWPKNESPPQIQKYIPHWEDREDA